MASAFLLVVPRCVSAGPRAEVDATPGELGFEPTEVRRWSAGAGGPRLSFWSDDREVRSDRLSATEAAAAFVVGDPYVSRSGGAVRTLLDRLVAAGGEDPLHLQAQMGGSYAVGRVDADGTGWVVADPLGLRCLYVGEDDTHLFIGSRAALVAASLCEAGSAPVRNLAAASWLAYTTFWSGSETGYRGVRLAPPGQYLAITTGGGVRWRPGCLQAAVRRGGSSSAASMAHDVVADVAEGLQAALEQPADRHVIQLTGGRDSRMLLAVALRAGIAHHFHYQTAGPDELADVRIAKGLASRYGLPHETLFLGMRSSTPYGVEQRNWVAGTGGMASAWEAPGRSMPDLRVLGVGGELLRSFVPVSPTAVAEDLPSIVDGRRFGRLGLVRPEIASDHHAEIVAQIAAGPGAGASVARQVHLYYALNRMRFTRLGPRLEVMTERRAFPLYAPRIVAHALSLDDEERQSDLLCLEVLRLCAPELVEIEFAGSSWDDRARRSIGSQRPVDRPADAPSPTPTPTPSPSPSCSDRLPGDASSSLVASIFSESTDERAGFIEDVLASTGNPIWSVLDRVATCEAAARWPALDLVERRELFGAVSAAIWASGEVARPAGPAQ